MKEKSYFDLGFNKIIEKTLTFCKTEYGRDLILKTTPFSLKKLLEEEATKVWEVLSLLNEGEDFLLDDIYVLNEFLERAHKGGILRGEELKKISSTLRTISHLKYFILNRREKLKSFLKIANLIPDEREVYGRIDFCIDENGIVRDEASETLHHLRKESQGLHQKIILKIEDYLKNPIYRNILQDFYWTIREGRFVLPVKTSEQGNFAGIIHGSSQSGETLFMEPEVMIKENNRLKIILEEILIEEEKVLRELSLLVKEKIREILTSISYAGEIDAIHAKAHLAQIMDGKKVLISDDGEISLINARCPLLILKGADNIIPNDIYMKGDERIMIISGPNAGGKSVTLLTTGLISLMTMTGFLPPCNEDSKIPLYKKIHTFFGDPQSIEESISTFSGGVLSLQNLVNTAGDNELILIDEIITATEPKSGECLASAFLKKFAEKKSHFFVATHYELLKTLCFDDKRFVNASVGFDPENKKPNYKLKIGMAGESNPFLVAKSIGISDEIIEIARSFLNERERRLDDIIVEFEEKKSHLEKELKELERSKKEVEDIKQRYKKSLENIRRHGDRMAYEARLETMMEIRKIKKQLGDIMKEVQKNGKTIHQKRRRIVEIEEKLKEDLKKDEEIIEEKITKEKVDVRTLKEGKDVFIKSLKKQGVVSSYTEGGKKVKVLIGSIIIEVSLDDLYEVEEKREEKGEFYQKGNEKKVASAPFQTEKNTLDVRGLRVDEALEAVVLFLDGTYLNEFPCVFIIHGMGTSSLRNAIREYLKKSPYCQSFRAGSLEEGGEGITIVQLK